jgi:transcription initiation factor TFIIF subunit beta
MIFLAFTANSDVEVAKLKIVRYPGQKSQVSLSLSEGTLAIDPEEVIPKEHPFNVLAVNKQTLGVFSQTVESERTDKDKIYMEGKIVEKLECRPYADKAYMTMKARSIKIASMPKQSVKQLDSVVTNFKPISDHKHNIDYDKKKKSEGKKSRTDKNAVMDILFNAFEKHQYYNIKDLVTITSQPISYLKEILKEICEYSVRAPHKNTWHLKPEYRHYSEAKKDQKPDAKNEEKMSESDDDDF